MAKNFGYTSLLNRTLDQRKLIRELGCVVQRAWLSSPPSSVQSNIRIFFASAKPTRWKYLYIPITFSTAHLFFNMLQYCYYRGELPTSWYSRPRDCLELYFEPYWWNESDFSLGWELITFYQNQDTWHLHKW